MKTLPNANAENVASTGPVLPSVCLAKRRLLGCFAIQRHARTVYENLLLNFDAGVLAEEVKRWTARRKAALVLEFIRGETTVADASRAYDFAPSEIENWVDDANDLPWNLMPLRT